MLLKQKNIKRLALAMEIGQTVQSFTDWKRRDSVPSADIAVRIASALGTTVEYLVTGSTAEQKVDTSKFFSDTESMEVREYWERVKALIKSRNTTQEGLAKTCGIPFHTLQGQIVKNRLPNTFDGYKIASALGTTVEHLVTGKEPQKETKIPDDLQAVINKYASNQYSGLCKQ